MNVKLLACGSKPWDLWSWRWGVSLVVDGSILFDTFSNYRNLAKKMKRYDINPDDLQSVVVSHEHADHLDGLWGLLKNTDGLNVYLPAHANKKIKQRVINMGGILRDGIGSRTIRAGAHVTDDCIGAYKGKPVAEHALVLETIKGLVLLVGCAHPGIGSFIQKARQNFDLPIYGVIGGLHLMGKTHNELMQEALALKEEGVKLIAPLHGAGWRSRGIYKSVFRDEYIDLCEGEELMLV